MNVKPFGPFPPFLVKPLLNPTRTQNKRKSKHSTMAISLRRALLSSRSISCALRTASIRSTQTFSYLNSSFFDNSHESVVVDRFPSSQATELYQFHSRRGFAKARKQKISKLSICQFSSSLSLYEFTMWIVCLASYQ